MKKIQKRFFNKVYISKDPNECWIFIPAKESYGSFYNGKKVVRAHRYSWEIHHKKKIPKNMNVCHKCDNPPCVNPKHLFIGTQKENIIDCKDKGRNHSPPRIVKKGKYFVSPRSVLNPKKVKKIKKLLKSKTIADVSRMFNVGESTIRHIKQGTTWKNVR